MKTDWYRSITNPVQRVVADVPWFGPTVSAVLLASLINVLTSTLFEWGGTLLAWVFILLLVVLAAGFIYSYNHSYNRWIRNLGPIADIDPPPQYPGLIALVSRRETTRAAIQYHLPALKHCWLIVTPEMQAIVGSLIEEFPGLRVSILSISNLYNAQACYEIIRHIYQQGAQDVGLAPGQVIADITGGTKPMTMGMIVACLEGSYPIEHVPTQFDSTGSPLKPLPPIQIQVRKS
jgi:hypothetical protein